MDILIFVSRFMVFGIAYSFIGDFMHWSIALICAIGVVFLYVVLVDRWRGQ
jgi:hypothetical protein